jgi:hypothetical protein
MPLNGQTELNVVKGTVRSREALKRWLEVLAPPIVSKARYGLLSRSSELARFE